MVIFHSYVKLPEGTEDTAPQPVESKLDVLSTKKHKAWPMGAARLGTPDVRIPVIFVGDQYRYKKHLKTANTYHQM